MLRLDLADRRRVAIATAVTLIALPSLWLTSRSEQSAAPNVATAGVRVAGSTPTHPTDDAAAAPAAEAATAPAAVVPDRPEPATVDVDPLGRTPVAYLDGPSRSGDGDPRSVAAPPADETRANGAASYRSTVTSRDVCLTATAPYGQRIRVTNSDNSRSVDCVVGLPPTGTEAGTVILHTDLYAQIADLTDAPVPIEIDW